MSRNSNDQGRAYEYAWMVTLYNALHSKRNITVIQNSSFAANRKAWNLMEKEMQTLLRRSANAAVSKILALEPRLLENQEGELVLEFQKDEAGIEGDVRDIVIKCHQTDWEIGLSIKHNHEAIKHSRLSYKLDFGREWFGIPCSASYWHAVKPIFDRLWSEKNSGTKWSDLPDKEEGVYVPLLEAFMDEVIRAYQKDKNLPEKMVAYLIGTNDYYKIVSHDKKRMTSIHSFNLRGTLNQPSAIRGVAVHVPVVDLPTELITLKFKAGSKNTVEMHMNNGWQLSFRIHNASTKVEPSLKFDIQFMTMPASILDMECSWK